MLLESFHNLQTMKFQMQQPDGAYLITRYEQDVITINGESHQRSLIVLPDRIIPDWHPDAPERLELSRFDMLLNSTPGAQLEVVLLGTGSRLRFPQPRLVAGFAARGIGLEVMDTHAACRTYNILAGEGRKVAAALILGVEPEMSHGE